MKIRELIKVLQRMDPERVVVIALNKYDDASPLMGSKVSAGVYDMDTDLFWGENDAKRENVKGRSAVCLRPIKVEESSILDKAV